MSVRTRLQYRRSGWFRGRFERIGHDRYDNIQALITDVHSDRTGHVTDHAWLPIDSSILLLRLRTDDAIKFWADVRPYRRKDGSWDYGFDNVSSVERIAA
jgi:hypothetical protein